ncbi:hypothetical protein M9H77_27503 [Catharanthus roseus]|uniref:Uncharacterized protein n=1 Tax=Catharanthus roseus TaxID=4058 RepID=A0ACC0AEB3_CATRO|nr:hypothetical protein M9H77_27503 [Catharanthus roseus]
MIGPQPIWNRLLGCLFDRVLGMPGWFGLATWLSIGDLWKIHPASLFIAAASILVQSLSSRLLVSPPDPSALPLLFSLGSGVLCFSVVYRPSVSPCLSVGDVRELAVRKEKKERDRGRRLPVIPSRLRPVSEGYNS